MTIKEFLNEQIEEFFPSVLGPWVSFDSFDPPFKREELRQMRREGILVLDERGKRFRLTLKATYLKKENEKLKKEVQKKKDKESSIT